MSSSSEDDIRAKRIARLNRLAALNAAASTSDQSQSQSQSQSSSPAPALSQAEPSGKQTQQQTSGSAAAKVQKPIQDNKDKTTTKPQSPLLSQLLIPPSLSTPSTASLNSPTSASKNPDKLLKEWIVSEVSNDILLSDFSNSSDAKTKTNIVFLENVHAELLTLGDNDDDGNNNNGDGNNGNKEEKYALFTKLFLDDDLIDRIILENLTEIGRDSPLIYLYNVWNNAQIASRKVSNKIALKKFSMKPYQEQFFNGQKTVLNEIIRLTASYGLIAFQIPDMFINNTYEQSINNLLSKITDSGFAEYARSIIEQAKEQDALLDILNIWFNELSKYVLKQKIVDISDQRYIAILNFYLNLLSDRSVASVFTQIPSFFFSSNSNSKDATKFEKNTLLGPILAVGPFGKEASLQYYDRLDGNKSKYQISQTQLSVQTQHKNLINTYLFPIIDKIIRGSAQSRNDTIKYFSDVINANHLRIATQPDYSKLSSHAFIANISLILIKLSLPFLKSDFKKIDKIFIDYFSRNKLLDISEETRINSTIKEATKYFQETKPADLSNFISDCFFLTLTYLQYGIYGIAYAENKWTDLVGHLERRIKELKLQKLRASSQNSAVITKMFGLQIDKFEKQANYFRSEVDSFHCFFLNEEFQEEIFEFVSSSCVFFARVIDPTHQFPAKPLKIPFIADVVLLESVDNAQALRDKSPAPFKYYPEYCIESIISYITYIIKYMKNPLQNNNERLNFFIEFSVVLLRCPELISNPHLKGKLVECLFYGSISMSQDDYNPGFMIQSFITNKVVLDHMLYALLDFYVMVEKTGASSQFYDKFNSRYHISVIIEKLWAIPHYRHQLQLYSDKHEDFFIRFIARMLNDTTYLLDESLRELSKIHHLTNEIEKRASSGNLETALNPEFEGLSYEELNSRLSGSERQARSFIGLSNKTIELFDLFTQKVPKAFTKVEIVDRLAGMLDFNLNQLVGPRYGELKVKNPEKYQFNPRKLLTGIAKIFINLSTEKEFVTAVSRDARSFRKTLFYKAESILSRFGQLDSGLLKQ